MALYYYLKGPPTSPPSFSRPKKRSPRLFPYLLILSGFSLLLYVLFPLLTYRTRTSFLSPLSSSSFTPQPSSGVVFGQASDLTKASSWFPAAPPRPRPTRITHYTLSIPKLKIKDAVVTIGGEDLMQSLIHYGGTALPGEYGNTVIFGHSVLPQFYNPKNYKTIFSLLPTLEPGDEIIVNFDGIEFRYLVATYKEVSPDDVSVLEQRYDRQTLTLITCVPPGTYWKRGVITAYLKPY